MHNQPVSGPLVKDKKAPGTPQSTVSKVLAASVYLKVAKNDKDAKDQVQIQAERVRKPQRLNTEQIQKMKQNQMAK